ncbi:hypothetical protein K6106_12555 [Pseudomonas fluorescens]|nr:hypothetical protein K6106_12555 [Pseudomonas fluorescens]
MKESTINRLAQCLPEMTAMVFMAQFSAATVTLLTKTTYLCSVDAPLQTGGCLCLFVGLTAFSAFAHWMLARGRSCATGLQLGYFIFCLLLVTPTLQYRPHALGYALGIVLPLLGLILMSTHRYQDMQLKLAEIRVRKTATQALLKKYSHNPTTESRHTSRP